jgi:catechol 2,3-dioxygenase-like lactoylglutathione lyase family enzyme
MTAARRRCRLLATLTAVAIAGAAPAAAQRISRAADKTAPTVRVVSPAPNERVERAAPDIEIAYEDDSSGVSVVTFRARINDRDISRAFEHHSRGATARLTPSLPLPLGENRLVIEVADRAGNVGRAEVTFINAAGGWLTVVADAGAGPERHAELVLDASGSMNDKVLDNTRMAVAKSAVKALVKGLPDQTPLGLRVFNDCSTITSLAPITPIDKQAFVTLVDGIQPSGGTPIVASLLQSFQALRAIPDVERISVIVTDGGESCSGSFAEVVEMAKEPPIRVIVIAFDITDKGITDALRQLADASGGAFIDAQDGTQLQRALEESLQRTTYSVHDAAGGRVGHGVVDGDRLMLPLGTYEVRFAFSSLRLSARVTIEPLVESTIRLHGKGRDAAVTVGVRTAP